MLRRAWLPLAILLLAACGVAPASVATPPPSEIPTPAPTPTPSGPLKAIKLACMGPHSGELAFLGKPSLQACQMAAEGVQIEGVKVEAVPADDAGSDDRAKSLATKLVGDRAVLGIVGPMTSGSALAAGGILDAAGVPFITPSASHPRVTESGWKTAHRLVARDDDQGPADAVFLFGPPVYAQHVYVADSGDADSQSLADEFQKRASALGMKIDRESTSDLAALVAKVKADVLFFPDPGARCAALLQEMRKQGAAFKLMATHGCHDQERLVSQTQGAAEGTFVSDIAAGPVSAYAGDAARILLLAIENAAKAKGGLDIRPADVNAEVANLKDFKGLVGPLAFNAKGDVGNAAVSIYQVVNGEFKQLKVVPRSS